MKRTAAGAAGQPSSGTSSARSRSERDIGGRTQRPQRSRPSGGRGSGSTARVHSAGGNSPRRPRDVKAGAGARMLAPIAIVVFALACLIVISSQGDDGSVKNDGAAASSSNSAPSSGAKSVTKVSGPTRSVYVVKAGDSFSAIAEKEGVDVDTLSSLNPDVDPRALQPGQKLKLKE